MILNARRSLAAKASRRHPPQIDIFFLNIRVRRPNLVSDSLNEVIQSDFLFNIIIIPQIILDCKQTRRVKEKIESQLYWRTWAGYGWID
jgi:hypothetical protein